MKTKIYAGVGLSLLAVNEASAQLLNPSGGSQATEITKQGALVPQIELWIARLLTLLYIVAVVYGLWGGFNILTAAGDEEKVTKGKKVLLNAVIGIVVIFLVGFIIRFLLGLMTTDVVTE